MASSTGSSHKKALVIGINKYIDPTPVLQTCIADAKCLSKTLIDIDFDVLQEHNCTYIEFQQKIDEFVGKIQKQDITLFYFAGHGLQSDEKNYLISSDYNYDHSIDEKTYLARNSVNAQYILHKITMKQPRTIIFILDCCRTKKIKSNFMPGLSPMDTPPETLLVFSCGVGRAALDETRNRQNSIFTESLLRHIATPDEDIESLFMKVTRDVRDATDDYQIPYRQICLTERIFLAKSKSAGKVVFYSIFREDQSK
ncbi:unnamed protein product [Rotaria sp. Silwood2]|nr:unnamed protein product [Rotaria sp. Silwood2]CAF2933485.1 unnamed protein product [Rotaria sp. Silwood2]CAF3240321.1 unnamed protein product [Rotaria sp. Silwood2]CAF3345206.1 unnamed protein product [Rotaria sp. Silwood2]CAF3945264.1 unnamed protein product [Rotaria sp. Silwood2]